MSIFAILGSGFGLYGYLPALVDGCAQRIVLPERYRARFIERPELARFVSGVQWRADEDSVLDCAEGAVLALPPINQSKWIPRCLSRSNIKSLLLEKPLAHSPEVAAVIFDDLIRSCKVFRLGYTFRYTTWGKKMLNAFVPQKRETGSLSTRWSFLAHHFRHDLRTWKRFHATGGGAVRFYGIQIIALLAEIGYRDVTLSRAFGTSPDEVEKWIAVFAGSGLPECEVVVDTRATVNRFQIEQMFTQDVGLPDTVFANLSDPFDAETDAYPLGGLDRRVPLLSQLCRSLCEEDPNPYEWYDATIKLWGSIEAKTQFEVMSVSSQQIFSTFEEKE